MAVPYNKQNEQGSSGSMPERVETGETDHPEGWEAYAQMLGEYRQGVAAPSGLDDRLIEKLPQMAAARRSRRRIRSIGLPAAAVASLLLFFSLDGYFTSSPQSPPLPAAAPALELSVPAETEPFVAPVLPEVHDELLPLDIGDPSFPSADVEIADSILFEMRPAVDTPVTGM